MGKQVKINADFSSVLLPSGLFDAGETTVLTDAEYAALPSSTTRALTVQATVADPVRPTLTSGTNVDGAVLQTYINKQAFAGGNYLAANYDSFPNSTAVVKNPVVTSGVATDDAQGLAAGGWNMNGKGGLYRLGIYMEAAMATVPTASQYAEISLELRNVANTVLLSSYNWVTPVSTQYPTMSKADQQASNSWFFIPDNFGQVVFKIAVTNRGGIAYPTQVYCTFDLFRVAGFPV